MSRDRSPYAPLFERAQPREDVLTVRDLTGKLRQRMQTLGQVVVEGEVSGFKGPSPQGHLYFTLKDEREDAAVACAMFRRDAQLAGGERVANGARVRVRASPDLFAPRGQLQMLVTKVGAAGEGDLAARREALKKKLAEEGLFDPSRKRKLPSDPRIVGVVTSATGAAFQDIVKVARRRGNVRILLSPAPVQGEGAAAQLRRALLRLASVRDVDVIIIGRGGGSAEDLAAFDDEALARAIAECAVPVVAAVGHEIDTSIACLVADVRAATPSQAAELVVADAHARVDRLREARRRLELAMRGRLHAHSNALARLAARVRAPERALSMQRQRIDELLARLHARHPRTVISEARRTLEPSVLRMRAAMARALERRRAQLSSAAQKLEAISPLAVLARGYAIALDDRGHALRAARDVAVGSTVRVRLHEGSLEAEVKRVEGSDG